MPTAGLFGRVDATPFPAIAEGFRRLGWRVAFPRASVWRPEDATPFDAVVTHGTRLYGGAIRDYYHERGTPVLVADLPALRVEGYWALWRGAVNAIPDEAPPDRGGILPISCGRPLGPDVLICGQKPGDQAHTMDEQDVRGYFTRCAHLLREKLEPGRRVIWRPHPEWPHDIGAAEFAHPHETPLSEQLADNRIGAVLTFNSTCGPQALAAGLPVYCDRSSFYADAAETGLPPREADAMRPPTVEKVRRVFERVGYTQWTEAELATGEPQEWSLSNGC